MYSKMLAGLGVASLMLASAPLALAHENGQGDGMGAYASAQVQLAGQNNGLHFGPILGLHLGERGDSDSDGDGRGPVASTTYPHAEVHSHVAIGTITSVNGSSFTIGGRNATTTVTTDGSTVFWGRGGATTSAAVAAGSHVVVLGTTTATSTSGNTFAASIVLVFTKAWGGLRHFFHF